MMAVRKEKNSARYFARKLDMLQDPAGKSRKARIKFRHWQRNRRKRPGMRLPWKPKFRI